MTGQNKDLKDLIHLRYQNLPEAERCRWDIINLMAKTDGKYSEMMDRCVELEAKYEIVLNELTTEQMNIICDFLMHCEAMSDRLLEITCAYMRFPE